jgi:hypothetical protein
MNQPTTYTTDERRKHNRYRLGIPVTFSWREARQAAQGGFGLTRDVSIRGAFVFTTCPPPLRAGIKLKAFFPPVVGVATSLRLHGEGRAVRVEAVKQDEAPGGFAVVGKRFVLRRGEE